MLSYVLVDEEEDEVEVEEDEWRSLQLSKEMMKQTQQRPLCWRQQQVLNVAKLF
jgi:hypothetical protein